MWAHGSGVTPHRGRKGFLCDSHSLSHLGSQSASTAHRPESQTASNFKPYLTALHPPARYDLPEVPHLSNHTLAPLAWNPSSNTSGGGRLFTFKPQYHQNMLDMLVLSAEATWDQGYRQRLALSPLSASLAGGPCYDTSPTPQALNSVERLPSNRLTSSSGGCF